MVFGTSKIAQDKNLFNFKGCELHLESVTVEKTIFFLQRCEYEAIVQGRTNPYKSLALNTINNQ